MTYESLFIYSSKWLALRILKFHHNPLKCHLNPFKWTKLIIYLIVGSNSKRANRANYINNPGVYEETAASGFIEKIRVFKNTYLDGIEREGKSLWD